MKHKILTKDERAQIAQEISDFLNEKNPVKKVALARSLSDTYDTELEELFLKRKSQKELMIFLACVGIDRAVRRGDAYVRKVGDRAKISIKQWMDAGIGIKIKSLKKYLKENKIPKELIPE